MRKDAGYPPLVTPSSQIVGTQAVFNVMMGRYKVLTGEFADLMLGYYGETIGPRDRGGDRAGRPSRPRKSPIDGRPADLLKPEWQELRDAAVATPGLQRHGRRRADLRDVPARWRRKFFQTRDQGPKNLGKDPAAQPAAAAAPAKAAPADNGKGPVRTTITYDVKLNGKTHKVTVAPA